jgi:8-oxo-dGTP diphosphatase
VTSPLAADRRGNVLLDLRVGAESILLDRQPAADLPLALVVAISGDQCLLVFNRWRQEWELPGGMLEPGESPAQAARREYVEETGQPLPELSFYGLALFRLAPDDRLEYAAIYLARIGAIEPFAPTEEIGAIRLWEPSTPGEGVSVLDADIARPAMASG